MANASPEFIETMTRWRERGHLELKARAEACGFTAEYVVKDDYTDYWRLTGSDGTIFSTDEFHREGNAISILQLQSFLQGVEYMQRVSAQDEEQEEPTAEDKGWINTTDDGGYKGYTD